MCRNSSRFSATKHSFVYADASTTEVCRDFLNFITPLPRIGNQPKTVIARPGDPIYCPEKQNGSRHKAGLSWLS
jgi:hypothetical protein